VSKRWLFALLVGCASAPGPGAGPRPGTTATSEPAGSAAEAGDDDRPVAAEPKSESESNSKAAPEPDRPQVRFSVRAGPPGEAGAMLRAMLRRPLRSQEHAFHVCYGKLWLAQPDLYGTVSLDLQLGAGGQIEKLQVVGRKADPRLEECALKLVKPMRFPLDEDATIPLAVELEIHFRPPPRGRYHNGRTG